MKTSAIATANERLRNQRNRHRGNAAKGRESGEKLLRTKSTGLTVEASEVEAQLVAVGVVRVVRIVDQVRKQPDHLEHTAAAAVFKPRWCSAD